MKLCALIAGSALAAMSMGQTATVQTDVTGGYGTNSAYNQLWNSSNVITINGKVTGRVVTAPMAGMSPAVSLLVKQPGKAAYEVQLGPEWYVSHMPVKVKTGDSIVVMGSRVPLGGRQIIMARLIDVGRKEVTFRSKTGVPMWVAVRPDLGEPMIVDGQQSINGTILNQGTTVIDGVTYSTFQVDTGSGTVNIVGAPTWYMNRQVNTFNVGTNVQVIGTRPPVQIGNYLFIADSIYTGGSVIVLRPF